MAFKVLIFLLASFLLVTTRVSSDEETFWEAFYAKAPVKSLAHAPVKAPIPAPSKAPTAPPVKVLPPVNISECPRLCGGRCKLHSRIRHCTRVCVTCCQRCKCVPPGTYGNKEMCGKCYTEMKTHGDRPKCP
ncbi:hypothetical protein AQUCO_00200306v1 [Aquilegia coerulea]|uniref:Gibberellin regulated protein n=1 Tax=Aquilegia coerulea TaxID=218851 RepID=A0A2G5F2N4_AQUCA|nr:hypothetical protein AQUCO_00200306v1 [Aquilegia coerulea]